MAYADNLPVEELMTIDEFLTWDGGGHQGKLILVEGRPVAMSPANPTHGVIQANISGMIYAHLRQSGSRCRVGTETPVVPPFARNRNVRVPDVAVTCAPPSDSKIFEDPILVVEVLSPTNRRETQESLADMAAITSVREILVVESEKVLVQLYRREADGSWPDEPAFQSAEMGAVIELACVDMALPLNEIYRGAYLSERTADDPTD